MPRLDNMVSKETYVEIAVILDRSGSMSGKEKDVIGGYNQFLVDQKGVDGEAKLTTVLFDHEYQFVYEGVSLADAKDLDSGTYSVRGSTALYDAIGRTVSSIRGRLVGMAKGTQPHKVIVMIVTDGQENASVEFDSPKIESLLEDTKKENWEYMFLGADDNAILAARSFGFAASHVGKYSNSNIGTAHAYASMSLSVGRSRRCIGQSLGFDGIDTESDKDKK